jgi:anti-sigma B factor antagonist
VTAVLRLVGDVDFLTEDGFRAQAEQLLGAGDLDGFVVDLSDAGLLDSSGLSLLVDLQRLCREMGVPMTLRDVPPRVQRLITMSGLEDVLPVEGG